MEDNEAQRPNTCWNPKRHISLVSLLFFCNIAAVRCFVGVNVGECGQAVR